MSGSTGIDSIWHLPTRNRRSGSIRRARPTTSIGEYCTLAWVPLKRRRATLTRLLALVHAAAMLHVWRGMVYLQARNWDLAITECQRALEIDRQDLDVYLLLGMAYMFQPNVGKAVTMFNRALAGDPKFARAYEAQRRLFHFTRQVPRRAS